MPKLAYIATEWFAARRQGVTASEIAAILGLSPWDSAFAIYHRKMGVLDNQPDSDVLSLGRRLEPWIA
ncbi:MAG: YqaJ viral recombinase family protein [Pseudonocardia sp.]|nr:YqaJ viral recombinase family protein [Pseudonocardia sp.]